MIFRDKNLQLVRFVDETGDPARRLDSFEGRGHFEPGWTRIEPRMTVRRLRCALMRAERWGFVGNLR
jgi:hypothetical protein